MKGNDFQPPATVPIAPLTYSAREVCTVLGIGGTTLYRLAKKGELRPIHGLGRKRYPIADVQKFAANVSAQTAEK